MNQINDAVLKTALGEYLGWIGDPLATLNASVQADPGFMLGHTTIAALNSLGGIKGDAPEIRNALAAASILADSAAPRERLHFSAANAWAEGDIPSAAAFWEAALKDDPRDLLALRLAHDTHFYLGASDKLRDVPLSVLPAYDNVPAERAFVLGMAAFGLEESGSYVEAERAGREAVALNPADSWAIHAVAHVLEMQDRADEGVAWLRDLEPHWVPAAGLAVHQWWHAALYLIELGRFDEVLDIYDTKIRGTKSSIILDLVDASALLWRLQLLGVDAGTRWQELVLVWAAYAKDHVLVFNDLHIALAFACTGDEGALNEQEKSISKYAAHATGSNANVSKELGLPVIKALLAFHKGDYGRTAALLAPIYKYLAPIGGSNAQRDLIIQTLGVAAFKTGNAELAQAVIAERRRLKSGSPRAWQYYVQ